MKGPQTTAFRYPLCIFSIIIRRLRRPDPTFFTFPLRLCILSRSRNNPDYPTLRHDLHRTIPKHFKSTLKIMSTVTFEIAPRFAFEYPEDQRSDSPSSLKSTRSYKSSATRCSRSPSKFVERQIIRAWKSVTRTTKKSHRASLLPSDFVIVTGRGSNRRSILFA